MDNGLLNSLLQAIAVSSSMLINLTSEVSNISRTTAFVTLEKFKALDRHVSLPIAMDIVRGERHFVSFSDNRDDIDVTAPAKLYAMGILESFIKMEYTHLGGSDRLQLRSAVLDAGRHLLKRNINTKSVNNEETRILGMKIAALLAEIVVRDFPQRWPNFVEEVWNLLWYHPDVTEELMYPFEYGSLIGTKICLECLKLVTEECTDSDFNTKVSTSRRNDVLTGINESHDHFVPKIFCFLEGQYAIVCTASNTLHEMCTYLTRSGRKMVDMIKEEQTAFNIHLQKKEWAGRLVADCLTLVERFCQYMPLCWMLLNNDTLKPVESIVKHEKPTTNYCDFLAAILHLLREDVANIRVLSISCLYQLASRKNDFHDWMKLIKVIPPAISEANEKVKLKNEAQNIISTVNSHWVNQLPFEKELGKMLAHLLSAHISHITLDQDMTKSRGPNFHAISNYLNMMTEQLAHPSMLICHSQINCWISLLREPMVSQCDSNLLRPFLERVLVAYMYHVVKLRWEDIEQKINPHWDILEASWDDEESYNTTLCDLRSKSSQLFRLISYNEPHLTVSIFQQKVNYLLATHGTGEPRNCLDDSAGQLTQESEAIVQFEGLYGPLDNILQGLPEWTINNKMTSDPSFMHPQRVCVRSQIRTCLDQVANSLVSWNPVDIWLKFRRSTLLETLKWYWIHNPTTLPAAVETLLANLSVDYKPSGDNHEIHNKTRLSDDIISLRKRSGSALISISKRVPHLLVPWLGVLSERVRSLLAENTLLPFNEMHLFEFLSCVATAVENPVVRSKFVSDVMTNTINVLESPTVQKCLASLEGFLNFLGILQVTNSPSLAVDSDFVKKVTNQFTLIFSAFNQLLSVGKRCHEVAKRRTNVDTVLKEDHKSGLSRNLNDKINVLMDEDSICMNDLARNDPFVPLWPRILPHLLRCIDCTLRIWHSDIQADLLVDPIKRYALAISDDEAYLAKKQDSKSGGIFGKGGTAGSIVSGWDRRDVNLAPKWSGWFNELRNTCFQLLGLLTAQRVLYAPELVNIYPQFVSVVANPDHLRSMEHRHITMYMKQFVEVMLLSCPCRLYQTHLAPILTPLFEHLQFRLQTSWRPYLLSDPHSLNLVKSLGTMGCCEAAELAKRGGQNWIRSYYARGGVYVGDADSIIGDAVVEKNRVELSRSFSNIIQSALALKGEWALILANDTKQEHSLKKNQEFKGTPVSQKYLVSDQIPMKKNLRINAICHFLFLEDENIARFLILTIIQCLEYPDAYTCRRCIKICHRILETVAWVDQYTELLGQHMLFAAVKSIITEPKWMVGLEWEMINLVRDIYCRLVLGQTLLFGGQGVAMEHSKNNLGTQFEQAKTVEKPLQGGGILCKPSDYPRNTFASLPGIRPDAVLEMEQALKSKLAAKDQKDILRNFLRNAACILKEKEFGSGSDGFMRRATESESMLNQNMRHDNVVDIPEKLVTHKMLIKQETQENSQDIISPACLFTIT